ncbi:MAG: SPP1 phage holin family protein [Faecalibacterium prausnitzii]|nr:SPP1 phage holin family protein [Faecalibacterium prausnitzii]
MHKISPSTIARTAALALALTNQILSTTGHAVLPIESAQLVSTGLTVAAALVSWWKNNSFTPEAIEADDYFYKLKSGPDSTEGPVHGAPGPPCCPGRDAAAHPRSAKKQL